ncbi:hypothetical protein QTP88_018259 [Uroleucon formosanum]
MYVYIDRHETLPFNTDIMFLLAPNVCQDRYLFFQYVSATYYSQKDFLPSTRIAIVIIESSALSLSLFPPLPKRPPHHDINTVCAVYICSLLLTPLSTRDRPFASKYIHFNTTTTPLKS